MKHGRRHLFYEPRFKKKRVDVVVFGLIPNRRGSYMQAAGRYGPPGLVSFFLHFLFLPHLIFYKRPSMNYCQNQRERRRVGYWGSSMPFGLSLVACPSLQKVWNWPSKNCKTSSKKLVENMQMELEFEKNINHLFYNIIRQLII